mmetsp:Transcript_13654/g.38432  ORF Transcript_13654/g.38432 Transcript_13654/m.38432 type:complete len:248 (+) Transcript_13654:1570-2313(+)
MLQKASVLVESKRHHSCQRCQRKHRAQERGLPSRRCPSHLLGAVPVVLLPFAFAGWSLFVRRGGKGNFDAVPVALPLLPPLPLLLPSFAFEDKVLPRRGPGTRAGAARRARGLVIRALRPRCKRPYHLLWIRSIRPASQVHQRTHVELCGCFLFACRDVSSRSSFPSRHVVLILSVTECSDSLLGFLSERAASQTHRRTDLVVQRGMSMRPAARRYRWSDPLLQELPLQEPLHLKVTAQTPATHRIE